MNTANIDRLFEPYTLNDTLTLNNRMVMAPMTRCMADDDLVATQDIAEYYARRADVGLIITEGTIVRADGQGYPNTPGIFTSAQTEGWRVVTDRVHAESGKIFAQLWHVGRVSHPTYLSGELPVAPSAIGLQGRVPRTDGLEYGMPRALRLDEIPGVVSAFAEAARNAMLAGFDGVEVHGANGYLLDQFLHWASNCREDVYGGSVERMARFVLEVMDAVINEAGAQRVGLRLSPAAYFNMEHDPRDVGVFEYLLGELSTRGLAYVHTGIFDDSVDYDYLGGNATSFLRKHYSGTVIAAGSYSAASAAQAIAEGKFDLVAMGRPFIANPDLVAALKSGRPINAYDESMLATLY